MPRFAYLGDHEAVTLWGIRFPQGVAVDVEDAHAIGKLRGNSHFSEVLDGAEVMPQTYEEALDAHERKQTQAMNRLGEIAGLPKRKPGRPRKDA